MRHYIFFMVFLLSFPLHLPAGVQKDDLPPFRIGLNFPFRSPETASLSTFLNLLEELKAKSIRQMTFADVMWSQIEQQDNQWDFVNSDSVLINEQGLYPVPTLFTMNPKENTPGLQVPWRACYERGCGWFAESDSNDTKDYIQTVISRYKNYTRYWEIGNELDSRQRRPECLPPHEIANFLILNRKWIRAADPQARILLPGLLGTYGIDMNNPWSWLREVLDAGGGEGFDIMNYHDYNAWWTLPAHFDTVRAILDAYGYGDKPIWVSECSVSSDPSSPISPAYASENEQAADVWRRSSLLFAKGAQVWFWHSFWSSGGSSDWREFGLLNSAGKKKKSYFSYKLLLEKIEGFTQAIPVSLGTVSMDNAAGGEGVWVVRYIMPDSTNRWVMWSPDEQTYSLNIPENSKVVLTDVVPRSLSTDRETAEFDTQTLYPGGTNVEIQLSAYPLLVEISQATALEQLHSKPTDFKLHQNFPNPFNPVTYITVEIPRPGKAELQVFDITGKKVAELFKGFKEAGKYTLRFDASKLASGVFFYRLSAGSFSDVKRMLLVK